ncbi:hypothetical protein TRVL_07385 [Trypanosoma vivax]|nr:hypothetical protein TRVL_07385 [Trypanosoma vivax]
MPSNPQHRMSASGTCAKRGRAPARQQRCEEGDSAQPLARPCDAGAGLPGPDHAVGPSGPRASAFSWHFCEEERSASLGATSGTDHTTTARDVSRANPSRKV